MRALIAAFVANVLIAVAKLIAAALTGSAAMLAEGIHSIADTGNQALLLIGDRLSRKPPDPTHPFGHGRELYFWSLVVAMLLFGMGGGLSIYEGIAHLKRPAEQDFELWNYAVLAVAFAAEAWSLSVASREFNRRRGGRPLWRAFRDSKDPRIFIPLAEDTAALLGILIAFCGVFFSHRLGMPAIDAASSIAIGLLLCVVALVLGRETRSLLVGEPADDTIVQCIRKAAAADQAVVGVERILTIHTSPESISLNLQVIFRESCSVRDVARAIRRLKERITSTDPRITWISVEVVAPD